MKASRYYKLIWIACSLLAVPLSAQDYCIPPVHEPNFTGLIRVAMYRNGVTAPMHDQGSTISDLYKHYPQSIELQAGGLYDLHITTRHELLDGGFSNRMNTRVWVDWNSDGDFTDAGEEVGRWNDHEPGLVSAAVDVPTDAAAAVRMRVYTDMPEADGHDTPTPCGYEGSDNPLGHRGEVEDYTLTIALATGIHDNEQQTPFCHPNPCTESVFIPVSPRADGSAAVIIYNALGEEVARPFEGILSTGEHMVEWRPGAMANGLYYYRIQTQGYSTTGSVVLHR